MWFACWGEGGGVGLHQENTSVVGGWDMARVIGVGY